VTDPRASLATSAVGTCEASANGSSNIAGNCGTTARASAPLTYSSV